LPRDDSWKARSARSVDRRLVRLRPTFFAYQFVARLRPHNPGSITHDGPQEGSSYAQRR